MDNNALYQSFGIYNILFKGQDKMYWDADNGTGILLLSNREAHVYRYNGQKRENYHNEDVIIEYFNWDIVADTLRLKVNGIPDEKLVYRGLKNDTFTVLNLRLGKQVIYYPSPDQKTNIWNRHSIAK